MFMDQAAKLLTLYIQADIPVMLIGSPGVGKSDMVRQVRDTFPGWGMVDIRALLYDTIDFRGIPSAIDGRTVWNPGSILPDVARDGECGILFLDELNAAPPSVQAALYQLILDRRLGEYTLPVGWRIVAAGNKQSDKAAAQRMPTALANRFAHIDCEPSVSAWQEWAFTHGIAPELIAFINWRPSLLFSMDVKDARAFPTPRSWAQVSKILHVAGPLMLPAITGLVGEGAAAEFHGFLDVYRSLPKLKDVFADPATTAVPIEPSARYAVTCAISANVAAATMAAAVIYLNRITPEFATMGIVSAVKRDNTLKHSKAFIDWAVANQSMTL